MEIICGRPRLICLFAASQSRVGAGLDCGYIGCTPALTHSVAVVAVNGMWRYKSVMPCTFLPVQLYLKQMKINEAKLRTRKMATEYCQPGPLSLDTIIGRQTPATQICQMLSC